MEKSKLGLSTGIVGAIVILLVLFGGYTVGLLAVGYVLLWEKDVSLRVSALTALLVALAASVINMVVGLLPDLVDIFSSMMNIFKVYLNLDVVYSIANFFYNIVSLLKTVALAVLAVFSLIGKPLMLGFIKKLVA